MLNEPERLLPGRTGKMNLVADLALLWVVLLSTSTWQPAGLGRPGAFGLLFGSSLLWLVSGLLLRLYDPRAVRTGVEDVAVASLVAGGPIVTLAIARAVSPTSPLPPLEAVVPLLWIPLVVTRLVVFRPLYELENHCGSVIIVGTGYLARATGEAMCGRDGCRLLGFVTVPGDPQLESLPGPILGSIEDLGRLVTRYPVDEVYVAEEPGSRQGSAQETAEVCEALGLPFAIPVPTFRLGRSRVVGGAPIEDGYLHFWSDDPKPYQQAIKRLMDVVGAVVLLALVSPILLLTAVAVRLTSPGPVLFRQQRVGLRGRIFTMYKYRSMVVDAEVRQELLADSNELAGPVFKIRHDPRVTRVGAFIRRFSIDELPQLWNVLTGDMSLVGPRPPVPGEVEEYETWQRRRLSVRPGLTCIWQVSGRNDISFDRWMLLDMRYIDNWSLGLDLALLLKTIPAVLSARGAS